MILTRHVSRPQLRAWDAHLAQHEVTRAPYRVGGRVLWIAPWAGVTDPGNTDDADRLAPSAGLWSALASAVGPEATADLRAGGCIDAPQAPLVPAPQASLAPAPQASLAPSLQAPLVHAG